MSHPCGMSLGTVRRFVHAEAFPERQPRACRPGQLAVYDAYLRMRWEAGEHNAAHLWRELRARGFHGGAGAPRPGLAPPPPPAPPPRPPGPPGAGGGGPPPPPPPLRPPPRP